MAFNFASMKLLRRGSGLPAIQYFRARLSDLTRKCVHGKSRKARASVTGEMMLRECGSTGSGSKWGALVDVLAGDGELGAGHPTHKRAGKSDVSAKASEVAGALGDSAARGCARADLLDSETPVPGVTTGEIRTEIVAIAMPSTTHGHIMCGEHFSVTAGWGHFGVGPALIPGQGQAVERANSGTERAAVGDTIDTLGDTTFDIHLNHIAYWKDFPANVWNCQLGGYQVLKKWLSYSERKLPGRELRAEGAQHIGATARRITAILLATKGTC